VKLKYVDCGSFFHLMYLDLNSELKQFERHLNISVGFAIDLVFFGAGF